MSIREYIAEADDLQSYDQVTGEWKRAGQAVKRFGKWATDPARRLAKMKLKSQKKKHKYFVKSQKHATKADIHAMKAKMNKLRQGSVKDPTASLDRERSAYEGYQIDPDRLKAFTVRKQKINFLKHSIKNRRSSAKANNLARRIALRDLKRQHKTSYGMSNY